MPDYKIIEWNETNFDVNVIPFIKEAYVEKKYAFVSDYARLYILYMEGGIYFDADVEVLKSFDDLLDKPAFIGYGATDCLGTAVIASCKGNSVLEEFMRYYDDIHFDPQNLIPNPKILSKILSDNGMILDNKLKVYKNKLYIYPLDYFIVKTFDDFGFYLSNNSYSVHHYEASWFSPCGRLYRKFLNMIGKRGRNFYYKVFGLLK
jgi:mannosyltransferase OCH1-like enzyme